MENNIMINSFTTPNDKYVIYMLGLIWADGYIVNKGTGYRNSIVLECLKDDIMSIKDVINNSGKWNFYYRKRINRKEQCRIELNNRTIVEFLVMHDYKAKSCVSANKILNLIPTDLQKYFFRGLIDGDGCFYINQSNGNYQFTIGSNYEQDWVFVESLFNKLNIKYNICRRVSNKNNKDSIIRISNRKDIIKLGEYLYENFDIDKIGFERKYLKYKSIANSLHDAD